MCSYWYCMRIALNQNLSDTPITLKTNNIIIIVSISNVVGEEPENTATPDIFGLWPLVIFM